MYSKGISRLVVELPSDLKTKFSKKCQHDKLTMSDKIRILVEGDVKTGRQKVCKKNVTS